jgi:hypothetical protein
MAAGNFVDKIITAVLEVPGTLTTGDGKASWIAPADCVLMHAHGAVFVTGTTSGNNLFQIRNLTDTKDLLSTLITIAYNDSDKAAEGVLTTTVADLEIDDGDILVVDIDEVAGGTPSDAVIILHLIGR